LLTWQSTLSLSLSLSLLTCDPDKYIWCLLYVHIVSCLLEHIFSPNLLLEFYFLDHCWIYLVNVNYCAHTLFGSSRSTYQSNSKSFQEIRKYTSNQLDPIPFILVWKLTMLMKYV
jgi:hypothetical protein